MRRLATYFILPVWISAGFLDYLWHRRTRIETTTGVKESVIHQLMMLEGAPVVLSALFLEINVTVLALVIAFAVVHELTVLWDLKFTAPLRPIPAGEQVTHTFLEAPPFLIAAAAISTHWDQFLALLGHGRGRRGLRLQQPPLPWSDVLLTLAALTCIDALPHVEELWRCIQAQRAGIAGRDFSAPRKPIAASVATQGELVRHVE